MERYKNPSVLLLFLFVLLNGNNPVLRLFYLLPSSISYILWGIILALIFPLFSTKIIKTLITSFFIITLYILFSIYFYDNQNIGRVVQFLSNVTIALIVINYYKHTLLYYIEIVLKFICYYSIIIWGLIVFLKFLSLDLFYLIPSFFLFPDNEIVDVNTHAIFFNFRGYENLGHISVFRNPGFFWEPGALSGTVIMMYLTLFLNKKIRKSFDSLFYLLCFTVFSTFSILGIATIFLIFLYKLFKKEKGFKLISFKTLTATVLIIISFQYFNAEDSGLKQKFYFQSSKVESEKTGWESNRLGTAIFILRVIEAENLNFGVGLFTSFDEVMHELELSGYESEHSIGNGFFLLFLQLGIYLLIIFLIFLFIQLYKYYKEILTTIFVFVILFLLLQGEVWTNYPLIYLFLFLNIFLNSEKLNLIQNK